MSALQRSFPSPSEMLRSQLRYLILKEESSAINNPRLRPIKIKKFGINVLTGFSKLP
jgi:hypothetical protein